MKKSFNEKDILSTLKEQIPNILEYYNESQIFDIMRGTSVLTSYGLANIFMERIWDEPMRRCSHCGNLMTEGYLLGSQYACSDECRNALYDPDDAENARRLYLIDCYEIEPEEVEGMTADEIEAMYEDCEISDSVMYTEWS